MGMDKRANSRLRQPLTFKKWLLATPAKVLRKDYRTPFESFTYQPPSLRSRRQPTARSRWDHGLCRSSSRGTLGRCLLAAFRPSPGCSTAPSCRAEDEGVEQGRDIAAGGATGGAVECVSMKGAAGEGFTRIGGAQGSLVYIFVCH